MSIDTSKFKNAGQLILENPALARLQGQKGSFGNQYLNQYGHYRLQIVAVKSKQGDTGSKSILEAKVVRAEELSSFPAGCEPQKPHRVGDVLTYLESTDNVKAGGASRFNGMLIRAIGESDSTILSIPQQGFLASPDVNPLAFVFVDVDVIPRKYEREDGTTAWARKEVWKTAADVSDAEFAKIDEQRKASNLPGTLKDCMEALFSLATP